MVGLGLGRQLGRDAGVGLAAAQQERPDQVGELPRLGRRRRRTRSARPRPCGRRCGCRAGPGIAQSRIAQSSVRLFSTGVPVSATRAVLGIVRSALAVEERAFLTCCASSATTRSQPHLGERRVVATRMVPYVVSTNPSVDAGQRAPAAVEAAHRRRPGANRAPRPPSCRAGWPGRRPGSGPVAPALDAVQVQRDQGDRLAEAHVVGQAGAEAERGELGQPGQPVPLVVAQRRRAARRAARPARGSAALSSRSRTLSREAPTTTCSSTGCSVGAELDDAGERGGDRLGRLDRADQPLAGLAGDRRVDDGPVAAQPQQRRRGARRAGPSPRRSAGRRAGRAASGS